VAVACTRPDTSVVKPIADGLQLPARCIVRSAVQRVGTPAERKRRVMYDTGHNLPPNDAIRETLDWFDTYLGPVR
jgi:hypothetical protein